MIRQFHASRAPALSATTPRLLPLTAFCLACLLAAKSISLVRAAAPQDAAPGAKPTTPTAAITSTSGKPPVSSDQALVAAPAMSNENAVPSGTPPISDAERAVLLELRERRQELETREQTLAAREAVLAAAERKISARVDELKSLQTRLEALDAARQERDETSWRGLVKVYENMKPRDAATIMNDMEMGVLLPVLDRMKETKGARILAAMQPDKARQATAELAQLRQRTNSVPERGGG